MTEPFISVPVPASRVQDVYRLLAGEEAADVEYEEGAILWTRAALRRLADGTGAANVRASAILDVLVQDPETRFSTTDLVDATGFTREALRGGLSALTRHLNAHYDGAPWPFVFVWGPQEGLGEEAHYYVESDVAEMWRSVRGI